MKKSPPINRHVIFLGIVSFFTDISSEMIFSVFSVFFIAVLGASTVLLGLVEGLADFSSSSLDYVAGWLSDRTGKRKMLSVFGYGFSTLSKVLLAVSSTIASASAFRVIERLGKSFRGPPRDAWISSMTVRSNRGLSFGIHKALDKAGAIIGPLIAYLILSSLGSALSTFKLLFIIALVPAAIAVLVLFFIKEEKQLPQKVVFRNPLRGASREFKRYLASGGIFSLAYFSFGFLLLKAYQTGFLIKDVVLLYALFNIAFVAVSMPIGRLGDIIGRKKIIILGYILYSVMCLGFIFASSKIHTIILFAVFGIFYAIDEGQSAAYISDCEKKRRGSAIGFYSFMTGIIYLPASIIAGYLWKINSNYAFIFAAVFSIGALLFFVLRKK